MGKVTSISWCHHTFNPWWGCSKISPGCAHCYAEAFAKRVGQKVWSPKDGEGERRLFGDKHWAEPLKWNADAAKAGENRRVFCASMADVFEAHPALTGQRELLWALIEQTPHLDWLLLTKRPHNIRAMVPPAWLGDPRLNVWYGATCETQAHYDDRIGHLLAAPAWVHFVSYEPALGPLVLERPEVGVEYVEGMRGLFLRQARPFPRAMLWPELHCLDWLIIGGESGPKAREFRLEWADDALRAARACDVAPFMKQFGAVPTALFYEGWAQRWWCEENGRDWPDPIGWSDGDGQPGFDARVNVRGADAKGEDMAAWPARFRVREVPQPWARERAGAE